MPRVKITNPTFGYTCVEVRVDTVPQFEYWDTPEFTVIVEKDIDYDRTPVVQGDKPIVIRTKSGHEMTIEQAKERLEALRLAIEIAETSNLDAINGPMDGRFDLLMNTLVNLK